MKFFFQYSLASQKDRQQPTIQPTNHLAVVLSDFANIVFFFFQQTEYSTFEDIFTALHERKVTGALIDTYSAGSTKEMFAKHNFRVNKMLDYSSTYDLTQHLYASEISEHIQKNTEQLKVIILFLCFL